MNYHPRQSRFSILMFSIASYFGNRAGKISHMFKGCVAHWTYIKNKRGKFHARVCHWCGKREERRNGKWVYVGKYKKKGKK